LETSDALAAKNPKAFQSQFHASRIALRFTAYVLLRLTHQLATFPFDLQCPLAIIAFT